MHRVVEVILVDVDGRQQTSVWRRQHMLVQLLQVVFRVEFVGFDSHHAVQIHHTACDAAPVCGALPFAGPERGRSGEAFRRDSRQRFRQRE